MLRATHISIKNKLIVIQIVTAIVAILSCSLSFVFIYNNLFKQYEEESLISIAKVIGDNVSSAVMFGYFDNLNLFEADEKKDSTSTKNTTEIDLDQALDDNIIEGGVGQSEAEQALNKLDVHTQLLNATVVDKNGGIFAHYHRSNTDSLTAKDIKSAFNHTDLSYSDEGVAKIVKGKTIHIYFKIFEEGDKDWLGTIYLQAESQAGTIFRSYLTTIPLVLLIGLVMALVLASLLQKSISHPIRSLVLGMRQVSKKRDYSIRVPQEGTDEIAQLSQVFNEMLEQIQKRDKSLQEARDELENRVVKRTQQLEIKTQELQASNKELEQFAYVASHDLQEPLRMIGSFSQLIERRYANVVDKEMKEYIHYIVDGVARMQRLIKDLLALSRVGTRKANFKDMDLTHVILKTLSNLRYVVEKSKAEITYDDLPTLPIDEVKLMQLLQNLLSNAIKFRKEDTSPKIHIGAQERLQDWVISIQDNGMGIPEGYAEKIFMIFQRVNHSKYPGTGIGLAICKKVVEVHGGKIWFESEVGKGTTFYFSIAKPQLPKTERVLAETMVTM